MTESSKRSLYQKIPFFYGWIIFLMVFLIYSVVYGLRYSFGVFFTPLREEFGWTAAMTAGAMTLHIWVYGLGAPLMGQLANHIGSRKTVALGGILLGAGAALVSITHKIWHVYLFWGVIAAIGESALYVVPTMVLARFFERNRGKVVGWASAGVSVGQSVLLPLSAWLILSVGWRGAYLLFGTTIIVVVSLLGYVTIRDSPEAIGLRVDGALDDPVPATNSSPMTPVDGAREWTVRGAISTKAFLFTLISYFFMFGTITSVLTFLVPHITWLGIDPFLAAAAFSVIGVMSGVGSFLFGFVSDRIGRRYTIIITESGLAILFFIVTQIPPIISFLYTWAIGYGLCYGGVPEQYAALITDWFGRKHNTTIFGLLTFGAAIGGGLFPLIGGYLVDLTGNYYGTLLFLAIGIGLGAVLITGSKPPKGPPR